MRKSAAKNITPPNGWLFTALSITPERDDDLFCGALKTNTAYLGSRAVEKGVWRATHSLPEADRFVEVVPFPIDILHGTHNDILLRTKEKIREQVEAAQKEGRGLILGFSAWGGQQSLDVMEYLGYAQKISGGRAICIVGGPGLSAHSPEVEADLFAAGADIINLGGGKELAEWLGRLTKDDLFSRDANGDLIAPIPENKPFFLSSSKGAGVRTGGDLPASVFYNAATNILSVLLPQSGCVNRCDFCAVGDSLVRPHATESEDIEEIATQVNERTKEVRKMYVNSGLDPNRDPVCLHIVNPNPTQGHGFTRLENFLSKINMTEPIYLIHFLDALSFRTTENMKRHLAHTAGLLEKHEKLEILIGLSMDALQEKYDGEFIGRRIAGRLVKQEEYDAILINYRCFLEEISGKDWAKRLTIGLNQINHPAMTADVYKQKLGLTHEMVLGPAFAFQEYSLTPFMGTPIFEKHKGHFAPPDYMEKDWKLGYAMPTDNLSYWGNQFKNGDLLDCIEFNQMIHGVMRDDIPLVVLAALVNGWEDGRAKLSTHPFDGIENGRKIESNCINNAQKILDAKRPRIISIMEHYVNYLCAHDAEDDAVLDAIAKAVNAHVDFINRRELCLVQNNPVYANNPNCRKIIKATEKMNKKLNSTRYASKFDLRPQRSFCQNDAKDNPAPV